MIAIPTKLREQPRIVTIRNDTRLRDIATHADEEEGICQGLD